MYINLTVKFLPKSWERNFSVKEANVIEEFINLMSLKSGKDILKTDNISFNFQLNEEKRKEILDFVEKNRRKVDICLYADTCYEKSDFEEAVAFILKFPRSFSYYDDWNEEKYASFVMTCSADPNDRKSKGCGTWEHTEKIFAKPNMGIKKAFEGKYAGATNHETSDASILSPRLAEYMIAKGIDKSLLTPVRQRRGDTWAYFMDGRKNLIKSGEITCSLTEGPSVCDKCGKNLMKLKEKIHLEELEARMPDVICIGDPFECERWEITENALKKLKSVNVTEDFFFSSNQMSVVNKETFILICEQVPDVMKKTVPVFITK